MHFSDSYNSSDFSSSYSAGDSDGEIDASLVKNIIYNILCQEPEIWEGIHTKEKSGFDEILEKIKNGYPGPMLIGKDNLEYTKKFGDLASEHIPLELKLFITLRLLAGASYLDMIWYGVSIPSVHRIFIFYFDILYVVDDQINMPTTEEGYLELAKEWSDKNIKIVVLI